jgi:hypothetical protein
MVIIVIKGVHVMSAQPRTVSCWQHYSQDAVANSGRLYAQLACQHKHEQKDTQQEQAKIEHCYNLHHS